MSARRHSVTHADMYTRVYPSYTAANLHMHGQTQIYTVPSQSRETEKEEFAPVSDQQNRTAPAFAPSPNFLDPDHMKRSTNPNVV